MHTLELRPWRLVALFGSVLLITAYVPHPKLAQPLPQAISALVRDWAER
jgi:hypothetical protein